ncbi:MAG: hypothetical protein ACI4SR_00815 [Faecalibacillus sp.]
MNEYVKKIKKDFVVIYVARNGIMTFFITLLSLGIDISSYYNISFVSAVQKIFFNSIYTSMYFVLLWIFNYLIFEIYKIMTDWYDETHQTTIKFMLKEHNYSLNWLLYMIMAVLVVVFLWLPLPHLFQYNIMMMFAFMILRSVKQIYKNRL